MTMENNFFIELWGLNSKIECRLLNKNTLTIWTTQLVTFCYRRNYIVLFALIVFSFQARSQSEERLQQLIRVKSKNVHDSVYYELFKLNKSSNRRKARYYSNLAYNLAGRNNHFLLQTKVCYSLAYLHDDMNQLDSTATYYHKAIQIALSHNFKDWLIYLYNDLGLLHERIDVYDSAVRYFLLSYNLASELHSYKGQATASGNIGLAYTYLENYPKAIFYFKESIAIKKQNEISEGLNLDYLNLARVYNEQGNFKAAMQQLNNVELSCKNGCDPNTLIGLNYSLGYTNLKEGNQNKSYSFFIKALALARKNDSKQWLANTLYQLSSFSITNNDYSEAITDLQEAEKIANEISHRRLLRDVYDQLSIIYDKAGAVDKARHYEKLYIQLKDSIFNKDIANNVNEIQLSDQRQESDAIIARQETALWKSYTLIILLGLVFVLTCAVVYLISRSLIMSRRYRKSIELEMIRMLGDREDYQRELFRTHMEFTALLSRVTGFLTAPVSTLLGLANIIKNSLGRSELKAVNSMVRLCTNILIVLENMHELVLYKNHDVQAEEIEITSFVEEISKDFKKLNSFLLLTVNIQKSVIHKIKSDRVLLLAAVNHAIRYFNHSNENPVVEVIFDQFQSEGITKIIVKHYSTNNISIPYRNQFNHLTVMVSTGKLKGDFIVIQRDDHTLFQIIIPTDFTNFGNKMVKENISME